LTGREHRQREVILTQPQPAKVRETASAYVLKEGEVFLLATESGDVPSEQPHGLGLFFHDCRYLCAYELHVNGSVPTPLSAQASHGFEGRHDLTNPPLPAAKGGEDIETNTVGIRRERTIRDDALHETIHIRNYGSRPARLHVTLGFAAAFEDIFVLKGFVPRTPGRRAKSRVAAGAVSLRYDGADGIVRETTLTFSPKPATLSERRASYTLDLDPREEQRFAITVTPTERPRARRAAPAPPPAIEPEELGDWLARSEESWLESFCRVRSSNPLFDAAARRGFLDLRLLRSGSGGLRFFAAGIPWFATLFGRDAAIVGLQTLPYSPEIARESLELLARYQAEDFDEYRDAEPGKILHELRGGELANLKAIPQSPAYYGSVDATLLFVILLAEHYDWTGDLDLARTLRGNLERAIDWSLRHADHDGDGFIDYGGRYRQGLVNQGWKDSGNAIVDRNGALAEPPIAVSEVQSYAYRAWREGAKLLRALGDDVRARDLEARAEDLRQRFERAFWSEELGCYRLALERGGRPLDVVSSNAGQVLWGGIASPERARRVAARLLEPDMFSGWGVRTISAREVAYNPMSYHLGSVWPHDNAMIVEGLRRYGADDAALSVFGALFDAAATFREHRLPELFTGYERRPRDEHPVRYPVACSPQAWAAGALSHGLWELLGLRPDAAAGRLRVVRPVLPAALDHLELDGLRIGGEELSLRFERSAGATALVHVGGARRIRVTQTDA
ncbi:MAG TPA: glycogen debranching N-terminal domain-containing protein, partial [Candidatus Limnocylindrales bacterium]|nr:glycogen debranching N-terminal domain-containing protein [Candidatus Limnocylindrales bacterium]